MTKPTKFTTEWNGIIIIGEYWWDAHAFDLVYPKYDKDTEEFEELTDAELACIVRQLEQRVEDYIDYMRESYREDIGYDRALDQAVEAERSYNRGY